MFKLGLLAVLAEFSPLSKKLLDSEITEVILDVLMELVSCFPLLELRRWMSGNLCYPACNFNVLILGNLFTSSCMARSSSPAPVSVFTVGWRLLKCSLRTLADSNTRPQLSMGHLNSLILNLKLIEYHYSFADEAVRESSEPQALQVDH